MKQGSKKRLMKLVAVLLTVALVIGALPLTAMAQQAQDPAAAITEGAPQEADAQPSESAEPSVQPSAQASEEQPAPEASETADPSGEPSEEPAAEETAGPAAQGTEPAEPEPSAEISAEPSAQPQANVLAAPAPAARSIGDVPAGEEKIGQVYVSIEDTVPKSGADDPGPRGVMAEGWVDLYPSDTMMSVVVRLADSKGLEVEGAESNYITSIGGLAAFDRGSMSGWMGTLNDWFTNEGLGAFTVANGNLKDGDTVTILYTLNYGEDVGGSWGNTDKTVSAIGVSAGTLEPAFDKDTHEYTLTLPAGTDSVKITPAASNKNYQVRASVDGVEYKRTQSIPVSDGTVITVKCGDPSWPSMNDNSGPAELYTLTVKLGGEEVNTPPARKAGVPAEASAKTEPGTAWTLDLSTIFEDADGDALSYKVSVDGGGAVPADESYAYTPQAAGETKLVFTANDGKEDSKDAYTVTLKAETAESRLQEAVDALEDAWYKMRPVCGTDTNVTDVMKAELAELGYGDIEAAVKSSDDEEHVAADGAITYFYDLNSYVGVANVDVVFTFTLGGASKEYTQRVIVGWDTVRAAKDIEEQEASAVTWDTIKGENAAADSVTSDLTLPQYAGTAYGDSLAKISWESSNPDVVSLKENGDSWDYEPYTGVVTKPEADTDVTLTATFTFKKDESCTVKKQFSITVKGYSEEEIEQKKAEMLAELNEKYTDGLLKDFTMQEALDRENVTGDIQLPIPSRLGLVNKEVTVSSSNADVVTINGYRAAVVCPFGEDAQVDLIVTLTRGSISVEKRIPLTVKAIDEAEIDREIELMEAAKAAYFDGINNGANPDKDHVTENLTAFREVNFGEGDSLVWTYTYLDDKGTGIRPVSIEPDDEMGELGYNLFQSSNTSVIKHENLLVTQPAQDTQVTISSVLSSTKFEKYAEQYPDNEKLQKLYRQPVSVTVTVKAPIDEDAVLADIKVAVDGVSLSEVTGLYVRETDWDENYDDVIVTNVEQTWQLRMKRDDIAVTVVKSENANIALDGGVAFTDEKVQGNVTFRFTKDGVSYEKEVLVTVPVHIKTVQEQIDGLTALFGTDEGFDLIKGDNPSKEAVTQPLKLKTTASYYGLTGYSDVKLEWTSSDTDVIDPPSYGSDSVKVNRPAQGEPDAEVRLTLTVKKQYSSDTGTPGSVDIVLKVPAITEEEVREAKEAVDAALANVTLDGFTESGSLGKTEIDPQALDFDVQLKSLTDLIAAGMIEDTATNRQMEWEWSTDGTEADGNYLKINYLKCSVMRTTGTADTETNLILTLTYNGYSGSKTFPVTIKGLTEAEVEAANAEMKEYEAAIWNGLKGENISADFVTCDLGWDRENGSVAFYRMHKEDGQVVYTLKNGSCPANVGVELGSWKSSDPTVIGHTTGGYGTVDILELLKRPDLGEEDFSVTLSTNMKNLRYGNAKNADGTAAVPDITAELKLTVPAYTNELAELSAEGFPFDFDPALDAFSIEVPKGTEQVKITAKAKDPAASVTVNGQEPDESGSVTVALSGTGVQIPVVAAVQEQPRTVTLAVNYAADYREVYEKTGGYLHSTVKDPIVSTSGGEWAVIGLARAGYPVEDGYYDKYIANVIRTLEETDGVLDSRKYTEYSRVVLALTSIGYDVTNVGGYNLLEPLADFDQTVWQGINGAIYALIAFDSHGYEIPAAPEGKTQTTRENLIGHILEQEKSGGGWALFGSKADPDITAMALQALAPYYDKDEEVKAAADRALAALSGIQAADGGFGSWGSVNSESCAQVVVALTALGIDPDSDPRFVKNGKSALDALLSFTTEEGGFSHVAGGGTNGMATEQGYYALAAYDRYLSGKTSLYDMSDVSVNAPYETAGRLIDAIGTVNLGSENAIKAARVAYDALTDSQKKMVDNYSVLEAAEKKLAELQKPVRDVMAKIDAIGTVGPGSENAVKAARTAYDALDAEQKAYVTNYAVLTQAETKLAQLEKAAEVEKLIGAIGEVNASSKDAIAAARAAYDALSAEEKALVGNYAVLTAAERAFDALSAQDGGTQTETGTEAAAQPGGSTKSLGNAGTGTAVTIDGIKYTMSAQAAEVAEKIAAMPKGEAYDLEAVLETYKLYDALSDAQKAEVVNYADLEAQMNRVGVDNHKDDAAGLKAEGIGWHVKISIREVGQSEDVFQKLSGSVGSNTLLKMFEITLTDLLTGEEYTPVSGVTLRLPSPDLTGFDGAVIAHYADGGQAEYLECRIENGELVWTAESFSYFGVLGAAAAAEAVLEDGGADEAAVYRAMAADGAQAAPAVWPWILVICIGAAAVVLAVLAKKGVLHGKR